MLTEKEITTAVEEILKKDKLGKYVGVSNYKTPKTDYLKKLVQMDDNQLMTECNKMIWLSAYAENNYRSDYHWQCDACYDETQRRSKPEIYSKAYKMASKQI